MWRISSHWKKIFSAVWEEDNGGILHLVGKLRLCIPDHSPYMFWVQGVCSDVHVLSAGCLQWWQYMFWVQGVCSDARMLAQAKAHIRREWDLDSLIGCIKTHHMAARLLGALSISACALAMQWCACHGQEGMKFSNQSSDAWRSDHVQQSIYRSFSQHPDDMQASTDLIWQLHLYFQQSESMLPTAFITVCINAKSWMNAEIWVDDRLGPCQHIS